MILLKKKSNQEKQNIANIPIAKAFNNLFIFIEFFIENGFS